MQFFSGIFGKIVSVLMLSLGLFHSVPATSTVATSSTSVVTKNTPPSTQKSSSPSKADVESVPTGYYPLDTTEFFKENPNAFGTSTDPQTGDTISFPLKPLALQGQNGTFDVLLNGRNIGETSGLFVTFESFSPDGKYFVFETRGTCGAGCEEFQTQFVDIQQSKLEYILTKHNFVSSYEWLNDELQLTQYSYDLDTYKQAYRTSPKEVWEYAPISEGYTFVQNLPEQSATSSQNSAVQ